MKYDLVVIGSGPAGMSAAIKAAENGATVVIVDENPVAGGKLLGQLHEEPKTGWWIGKEIARDLKSKVDALGITCLQETEVWGIYPNWKIQLNSGESLQTDHLLIATGAAEKAVPIPGWTTPGVMAIGAAQVLNNYHRVKPGKKVAIIGVDPLSLTVAHELKIAGVDVVGIYLPPLNEFTQNQSIPKQMIANLSHMSHLAPNIFLRVAGNMAKNKFVQSTGARFYPRNGLKIWGIPLFLRKTIIEIEGFEKVEGIKVSNITPDGIARKNEFETIEVDCVCISGGLYPLVELAGSAKCNFVFLEELGGHVPLHSPEMETTQPGIFVAGNITGIEGAKIAIAQGELAGTVISNRLGLLTSDPYAFIQIAQKKVEDARKDTLITFQPNIEIGRLKLKQFWNEKQKDFT